MQNQYSLLYREEEREMNAYCNYEGIGLIPWGPLAAGHLCRPVESEHAAKSDRNTSAKGTMFEHKFTDADKGVIGRVEEIAKKEGWTMGQVALAWIDGKVASPIVGFSSPKRVEEAIITGKKLTEEQIKYLEEPYAPTKIRGHQ